MKDDAHSGEAGEPPEKPPGRETDTGMSDENEEPEWARKHVLLEWPSLDEVFRKTGIHDRPPGSGGFRPTTVIRHRRDRIIGKIHAKPDAIEDRIDRAVGCLTQRIRRIEKKEVSQCPAGLPR